VARSFPDRIVTRPGDEGINFASRRDLPRKNLAAKN
jgi:hypothetical protein